MQYVDGFAAKDIKKYYLHRSIALAKRSKNLKRGFIFF